MTNGFEDIEKKLKDIGKNTSPEIDKRVLDDAYDVLQQVPRIQEQASEKPIFIAAAAVIIIAITLGLVLIFSKPAQPSKQIAKTPQAAEKKIVSPIEPVIEETKTVQETINSPDQNSLQSELERVMQSAKYGDTDLLLGVLDNGSSPAKMLAAGYLAKIGDLAAAQKLEDLASGYTQGDSKNIFIAAAAQIRERLSVQTDQNIPAEPNQTTKYQFKPRGVLSGLITDIDTNEPVTDAVVTISIGRIYEAKTDANGFYYFDKLASDGYYRLNIYSKEYIGITGFDNLPEISLSSSAMAVKHFQLKRACMIEVQVVDENGVPVKEAIVSATSLADQYERAIITSLRVDTTNADGLIILGGLAPSDARYLIIATHITATQLTDNSNKKLKVEYDYAPGYLDVVLNDTNNIEYGQIVLKKGLDVHGYAEYADGVPAADLEIMAYPQWWHGMSPPSISIDPNGYFMLKHILPGDYRLQIMMSTGPTSSLGIPLYSVRLPPENNELLVVKIPRKSPQSLCSISGKISFKGPRKPNYVHIEAYSDKNEFARANLSLGPDGKIPETFTIDRLEPGDYRLTFSGDNIEQAVLEKVQAPTDNLNVELVYTVRDRPKLRGKVIDAVSQNPITKFQARLKKIKTLRGTNYGQNDKWLMFENPQGSFEIATIGPGIYQVQIAAPDYAPLWSDEVNTDSNETITIELTKGGRIIGKVIDENGSPIEGVSVIPLSVAGDAKGIFVSEEGLVKTDSQGQFVLENISSGTETLKAIHPDYAFAIVDDIKMADNQTTDNIEIILKKGSTVEGYVYDHQGNPLPNEIIRFQDDSSSAGTSLEKEHQLAFLVTDSNGYYRVAGLPEKMCYATRQREWENLGVVRQAIVPQNGKVSRLDFGPKPVISGRIIIDGQPLANRRVMLSAADNPGYIFKNAAITDSSGALSFYGANEGLYAVYYESKTKRGGWIKLTTVQIDLADVDLGTITQQLGRLLVFIEKQDPNVIIRSLRLIQGTESWGLPAGIVSEPPQQGQPYEISELVPGTYTITVFSSDILCFRKEVEVTGRKDQSVNMVIPSGTAGLYGTIKDFGIVLWLQNRQMVCYIQRDETGTYKLNNLPAGKYFVGGNMLEEEGAFASFDLADGQQKELNIDSFSQMARTDIAVLEAITLNENGIPISGAKAWLKGPAGIVEPMITSGYIQYFRAPAGKYELFSSYPGFIESSEQVSIKPVKIGTPCKEIDRSAFIRLKRKPQK